MNPNASIHSIPPALRDAAVRRAHALRREAMDAAWAALARRLRHAWHVVAQSCNLRTMEA